jgi:predicted permease
MQLVTESLILAALGGITGVAIAQWGGAIMRTQLLAEKTSPSVLTDSRVLIFVGILSAAAGLLTGLAPAFQAGRTDVAASLKSGSREGTMHRSRLRAGLLVAQAALSVVLLVGAGLFLRSLINVKTIRLGYDADRVLWVTLNARGATLDTTQRLALRRDLLAAAKRIPEVEHASRALTVPFWSTWNVDLYVAGIDSVNKLGDFSLQASTPEFFETMGTRILRGRGISAEDRANAPPVIVVGEAMAKTIWPNQDAIGKCIKVNADTMPCSTVVGIAEDVRRGNLTKPDLHYYLSIDQFRPYEGGIFVRTRGPADRQTERVRRELQRIMPGASYVSVLPVSKIIGGETRSWKLGATMFAVFGALALVLAAIGLYSVIAYTVTQRTHEMGVRVALGAQAGDVIGLIVREGLRVVIPGVALGAVIALAGGKWIAPLLFQVTPTDPPVMVSVIVTLVAVAVLASWLPATRASRVDPNQALRSD